MRQSLPAKDAVKPDTPLRLSIAALLAFPDGSMTASGLRREAARGRLTIEMIAGKHFTTLENIQKMRKLCRVDVKVPDYGSGSDVAEPPSGSSAMEATRKARVVLRTILSE